MEELETVAVAVDDLIIAVNTLRTALNIFEAEDLVNQYRKLDNRLRRSPITRATADVLTLLEGYLTPVEEEEDE